MNEIKREFISEKLINEFTNPDPVKSLLDAEKDTPSGPASLKSSSDFFSKSNKWVIERGRKFPGLPKLSRNNIPRLWRLLANLSTSSLIPYYLVSWYANECN
ncbi:hypothetical protein TNCV_2335171 [Trichonephila clavipes]|uniref:Uncharacterized protein n=1 Tax=Trichonephila clavipes TaxID=2585209 RepID=A0A8X6VM75_TRICX|nr:hypothetical protein TNCV_2335171 [Trichonephila clavipes]